MTLKALNFEIPDNLIQEWIDENSSDPRYVEKQIISYFGENYDGEWDGQIGVLNFSDTLDGVHIVIGYWAEMVEEGFYYG